MKTFGFSLKQLVGITGRKRKIGRTTGIPMTKSGRQRKVARLLTKGFKVKF